MTLTEFLLARIAEDEAVARLAARVYEVGGTWSIDPGEASDDDVHVARWSPDRVLAECEAKRAIVEDATNQHTSCAELDWVCQVLALPYADHPDYDEAWRP